VEATRARLEKLRKRILAHNGTVLNKVEGEVEVDDVDDNGDPRLGPVLVLGDIAEGSQLKLARPREVTVLGSLSGQVFGAYRVKAGNLFSGRLEGARNVDIVHDMGSKGTSNVDSWIVFEATSDPGFFAQVQSGLERLQELERNQIPYREAAARRILLGSLKDVHFNIEIFVQLKGSTRRVLTVRPNRKGKEIESDLAGLLTYVFNRIDSDQAPASLVTAFQFLLKDTIKQSLIQANKGGLGSQVRRQQGDRFYEPYVESVYDYLLPRLMKLWLRTSENFVQGVVQLADAPMILRVARQLAPFFQIEYPRWRYVVTGGKIVPEKIGDCNIACQLGKGRQAHESHLHLHRRVRRFPHQTRAGTPVENQELSSSPEGRQCLPDR
jgi:hypothetical protein